ncbi:DNA internalization-related competence protein ComEC/Rec2 [Tumebacillus lipolyticus]|uniref:DNA internalization-related competence protein ComEC/Rec2 n=1 Tax=Tumebacillus lipolyticus TaxID=1280370 RepID=A0ABW4ZTV8_9BACL
MRRPVFTLGLFFAFGIAMAGHSWIVVVVSFCMLLVTRKWLLVLAFAVGTFYASSYEWAHRPSLEAYVGQQVTIEGTVVSEPTWKGGTWSFHLRSAGGERAVVRLKQSREQKVDDGDLLRIEGVLERLSPPKNPGGFDARAYYGRLGIHYSLSAQAHQKIGRADRGLHGRLLVPLRQKLIGVVAQHFPGEGGDVIAGLLFGITSEIDEETIDSFRVMGVVHILAVSGANVAMLLVPFLALLKRLNISERKRFALGIVLVLLYGGVTAGGPSVVRACVMAVVWCISRIVSRDSDLLTSWALAGWIALLINPLSLQDLGFQLTMILTLGLFTLTAPLRHLFHALPDRLASLFAITLAAELLSVPLVLTVTPTFTPISFFANLLIVPILILLLPLSVLTILLGLLHPLAGFLPACAARMLLDMLLQPLLFAGREAWFAQHYRAPAAWWLCCYYAGWCGVACRSFPGSAKLATWYAAWRKPAVALLSIFLLLTHLLPQLVPQQLSVLFLDVGQGDAALIRTPSGQVMLVDSGGIPSFAKSDFDVGARIVVPALSSYGIDRIDVLVLTHADEDHIKGMKAVLQHFSIGQVWLSNRQDPSPFFQDLLREIGARQIPIYEPRAGWSISLEDRLRITFWNPPKRQLSSEDDSNENSLVFSLQYKERTFLFTGDAEGYSTTLPHVDVLKVPHHGSRTDRDINFSLDHAILSVGARNSYGHPAPSTIERLEQKGAHIWRTDRAGAVECTTDGRALTIRSWLGVEELREGAGSLRRSSLWK